MRRGQPQVTQALSGEKNTQVALFIYPLASFLQENAQEGWQGRFRKGKRQAGGPLCGTGVMCFNKTFPSRAMTPGMRELTATAVEMEQEWSPGAVPAGFSSTRMQGGEDEER